MTNQTQNNNLKYLIHPTFIKVNRLFVLSFENEEDRASFSKKICTKCSNKRLQCVNQWKKVLRPA